MGSRSVGTAVLAVGLAIGVTGGAAVVQSAPAEAANVTRVQSSIDVGGCVIRLYSYGPRVHANHTHTCVGVKSVNITGTGRLQIHFSEPGRTVGLSAGSDETLTGRGIAAGIDGTSRYATVSLYDTRLKRRLHLGRSTDYRRAAGASSNIWFSSTRVLS